MRKIIQCANCKTHQTLCAQGLCGACYTYQKRTGRPRPDFPIWQDRYCVRCGLWCRPHARGLCHKCYQWCRVHGVHGEYRRAS